MTAPRSNPPDWTQPPRPAQPRTRVQGGLLDPKMLWTSHAGRARASSTRARCGATRSCSSSRSARCSPPCSRSRDPTVFAWLIVVWLWLTVLFANLAEAVAEGRGKAQAETLRRAKTDTMARRLVGWRPAATGARGAGRRRRSCSRATSSWSRPARSSPATATSSTASPASTSRRSPASRAPVIRESGGDRSVGHRRHEGAVRPDRRRDHPEAGRELHRPDDRARRGRQPAEDAERDRAEHPARVADDHLPARRRDAAAAGDLLQGATSPASRTRRRSTRNGVTGIVLVSLLVCLIPTTIGALLSAIGIAGMDRLVQRNVLAMSGARSRPPAT